MCAWMGCAVWDVREGWEVVLNSKSGSEAVSLSYCLLMWRNGGCDGAVGC